VDEKPKEDYSDIGGLDKQITELVEAIVLPIKHKDRFTKLGIKPPKVGCGYSPTASHLAGILKRASRQNLSRNTGVSW
jgi:26S proteasome regulatory subunit T5